MSDAAEAPAFAVLEAVSRFKDEYLSISVPALTNGTFAEVELRESRGSFVTILFYSADFSSEAREELLELTDKKDEFDRNHCKVGFFFTLQ